MLCHDIFPAKRVRPTSYQKCDGWHFHHVQREGGGVTMSRGRAASVWRECRLAAVELQTEHGMHIPEADTRTRSGFNSPRIPAGVQASVRRAAIKLVCRHRRTYIQFCNILWRHKDYSNIPSTKRRVGGVGSTHLSCRRQMMLRALPLLLWQQQLLLSTYERCSSIADLQRKKKPDLMAQSFQ